MYADAPKPDGGPYCENYVRFKRKVVRLCDGYVGQGVVDMSVISYAPPRPMPESPSLLATLSAYSAHNEDRGLARGTRDCYDRLAREYALFLEGSRISRFDDADAASALGFMVAASAKQAGSATYHIATNFRPFLKWLGRGDLAGAVSLSNPTREHRMVPMLADGDEEAVAETCCNGSVPARDSAITLLALTTGMRACDIINLGVPTSIGTRRR